MELDEEDVEIAVVVLLGVLTLHHRAHDVQDPLTVPHPRRQLLRPVLPEKGHLKGMMSFKNASSSCGIA